MQGMISDKLVALIEKNADKIIMRWTERLSSDPATPSFSPDALQQVRCQGPHGHSGAWGMDQL